MIRHRKKTSQRHLRRVSKTLLKKLTYEVVFKVSKRQQFCPSNQCLSKALFRQGIHLQIAMDAIQGD